MGTNYNGAQSVDYSGIQKGVPYPGATAVSGRWIAPATGTITGLLAMVNRLYVDDFYLPNYSKIDQIAVETTVAGAAGATARLGIYSDFNSVPNDLIAEAATVADTATIGVKTLNISTPVLPPGRYWLACVSQNAAASFYANSKNPDQHWNTSPGGALAFPDVGFAHDGVTGPLPSKFVSVGSLDAAIRVVARIS